MINYSQNKEQDIIAGYFLNRKGVFADFGANDGITFSNTYALVQCGWYGVAVEPSPKAFAKLKENYRQYDTVELFNCAVTGETEGQITLYESGSHLGNGDVSLLSTVNPREMDRWKKSKEVFIPVTVRARPVKEIIGATGFEKINLISMDIEGSELEVMAHIDFTALGTEMLIVEFNGKNEIWYNEIASCHGLRLIHKNAENLIFVR